MCGSRRPALLGVIDGPPGLWGAGMFHCIELSLKAVLLNRGYTADQVVDFRHNLNKLFNETRQQAWTGPISIPRRSPSTHKRCWIMHFDTATQHVLMCSTIKKLSRSQKRFFGGVRTLGARRSLTPRPKGRLTP